MCVHEWVQTALTTFHVFRVARVYSLAGITSVSADVGWVVAFIMPAFTAASVQSFYAWRIYILSQHRKAFPMVVLGVSDHDEDMEHFKYNYDQGAVTAWCAGVVGAVNLKVCTLVASSCVRQCSDHSYREWHPMVCPHRVMRLSCGTWQQM